MAGRLARRLLVGMVRLYQRTISRVLPPSCRFVPSCSSYMIQAVERHGALRGVLLGAWRILRCNPFCRGGYDPVPDSWGRAQGAIPPGGGAPGRDQEPDATGAQTKS